ncbi:MAG: hypothetical protein QOJ94_999 [Sphingomonadales bacterium]|jgi:hypothetical protein|nr:hypothetical protein [Sphingomonadales bacterium]
MHSVGQAGLGPQTSALSRIPAELRERPQWCVVGPGKRPITADGRAASPTDPGTWADFDTACRSAANRGCGVGYVLTADDPFACIDLDVKDGTPPDALDRYRSIIEAFDSYTERSRSGRGWHVWVRGKIGRGRHRDGVEVYSQERFIICTGDVFRERPVAPRQPMLDNMVGSMEPPAPEVLLTGEDVPDLALAERASADAGELGRLFRGEWEGRYPSQSEADLALVKLLAPLTSSPRECWATFRLSVLGGREKAARPDYMRRTLGQAAQHLSSDAGRVQHGREVAAALFRPDASAQLPPPPSRAIRLLLDGELDRLPPLRWLVKSIIPDAGIGAIYGDSGTFKSFLTLDLLAHISNGREWFGQRVKAAPAVYVPFEGQGGIPNRVRAWRLAQTIQRNPDLLMVLEPDSDVRSNIAVVMDPLNLRDAGDRDALVATLIEQGWAGGVLCVDTLAHASNGIEENSSAMGEMIGIFRDLQQRLGGVILLVHHSGKDQTRGMRGWSGLHAAMDFVVECQKEGEGDASEAQFRLSKVKDGTTGTVFRFQMQMIPLGCDEDGDPITSLVVCPKGEAAEKSENPFKTDVDEPQQAADDAAFVEAWIREIVISGKRPTGRGLEAKRLTMKGRRVLTQKRLRDAIESLKEDGRLSLEPGGPSGAKWLRPTDLPNAAA